MLQLLRLKQMHTHLQTRHHRQLQPPRELRGDEAPPRLLRGETEQKLCDRLDLLKVAVSQRNHSQIEGRPDGVRVHNHELHALILRICEPQVSGNEDGDELNAVILVRVMIMVMMTMMMMMMMMMMISRISQPAAT